MLDKSIVGKEFEPFSFTVEKGKIREFCLAIGDDNPLFMDDQAAKDAGHPDTPIPLTFQTTFVFWGCPGLWDDMVSVGIDIKRLLHLKEEYDYHKPIYPGTTVFGQMRVSDVKTGKMEMATMETVYKDKNGDKLITARMSIIIRPE